MADILPFPDSSRPYFVVDKADQGFVLQVVNRPPIPGFPKRFPAIWDAITGGFKANLDFGLPLLITNEAAEWQIEMQIGPRP